MITVGQVPVCVIDIIYCANVDNYLTSFLVVLIKKKNLFFLIKNKLKTNFCVEVKKLNRMEGKSDNKKISYHVYKFFKFIKV
jgi:hypothetical protein